eukprot:1516876-Pyramimonas_sp.AAC.1
MRSYVKHSGGYVRRRYREYWVFQQGTGSWIFNAFMTRWSGSISSPQPPGWGTLQSFWFSSCSSALRRGRWANVGLFRSLYTLLALSSRAFVGAQGLPDVLLIRLYLASHLPTHTWGHVFGSTTCPSESDEVSDSLLCAGPWAHVASSRTRALAVSPNSVVLCSHLEYAHNISKQLRAAGFEVKPRSRA